jgi:hypothetical protein
MSIRLTMMHLLRSEGCVLTNGSQHELCIGNLIKRTSVMQIFSSISKFR